MSMRIIKTFFFFLWSKNQEVGDIPYSRKKGDVTMRALWGNKIPYKVPVTGKRVNFKSNDILVDFCSVDKYSVQLPGK